MTQRFANKKQRRAIAIMQDFKCASCGDYLCEGFHVDHIVPFCFGGATTLDNLQGLCESCHIRLTAMDGSRLKI